VTSQESFRAGHCQDDWLLPQVDRLHEQAQQRPVATFKADVQQEEVAKA
jgi:hypothetical protein